MEKKYNKIILITAPSGREKIQNKEFLEWEMVYEGKYYGTLKSEMSRIWNEHKIPVLDIDVQGAIHVQQQYPINTIALFIQAPSIEDLKIRLQKRGSETEESLKARLDKSSFEMTFKNHFENIVVNKDFAEACNVTENIISEFLKQ